MKSSTFIARVEPHPAGGYVAYFQLRARPEVRIARYGSWWQREDALLALQLLATEFVDDGKSEGCWGK